MTKLKLRLHDTGEVTEGASVERRDSSWEKKSGENPVSSGVESS